MPVRWHLGRTVPNDPKCFAQLLFPELKNGQELQIQHEGTTLGQCPTTGSASRNSSSLSSNAVRDINSLLNSPDTADTEVPEVLCASPLR